MAGRIEHVYVRRNTTVVADGDSPPYGKAAVVSDAAPVRDFKRGLLFVPDCKREAAFAVDGNVVPDDQIPAALHPVDENPGLQISPMPCAVRLEEGFAYEDPHQEVVGGSEGQKKI